MWALSVDWLFGLFVYVVVCFLLLPTISSSCFSEVSRLWAFVGVIKCNGIKSTCRLILSQIWLWLSTFIMFNWWMESNTSFWLIKYEKCLQHCALLIHACTCPETACKIWICARFAAGVLVGWCTLQNWKADSAWLAKLTSPSVVRNTTGKNATALIAHSQEEVTHKRWPVCPRKIGRVQNKNSIHLRFLISFIIHNRNSGDLYDSFLP